jgi:Zn-dependent protease with chaperone function
VGTLKAVAVTLEGARFSGDRDLLQRIVGDEVLKRELQRTEILRGRSMVRARLLSEAVRVNVRLLPNVAESFARLSQHLAGGKPLEPYVFAEPGINAFVAEGTQHILVGVSSGAISALSSQELDFVIGHELGHAFYGHLDVPANLLIETSNLDTERRQLLLAWRRAAEVSADRAGLACAGSLEVAANAMFKTISGLGIPGLTVAPAELAQQWEHLVDEMLDDGRRELWQLSHPLPPLRMKALMTFWQMGAGAAADAEVQSLLALMDASAAPGARGEDPYLARFVFWGGIYVALADGAPTDEQRMRLRKLAPSGIRIDSVLLGDGSASEVALERFREAQRTRRAKLSAGELHRIITGLIDMAGRDGRVTQGELDRLHRLGKEINLTSQAMDLMISKQIGKD